MNHDKLYKLTRGIWPNPKNTQKGKKFESVMPDCVWLWQAITITAVYKVTNRNEIIRKWVHCTMQSTGTWYKAHQRIKLMTNEYNYSKLFLKKCTTRNSGNNWNKFCLGNNVPWFKWTLMKCSILIMNVFQK